MVRSATVAAIVRLAQESRRFRSAFCPICYNCPGRITSILLVAALQGVSLKEDGMSRKITSGRVIWGLCLAILFLLGGGYAGVSLLTAERLTRPTNHPLPIDPHRISTDAQAWSTRTSDGVTLRGWYLADEGASAPDRAGPRDVEFLAGDGRSGRDLHRGGFDVLLFDLRGHGQSDPSRLYLGRRERADIRAVMSWAAEAGLHRRSHRLAGLFHGRLDAAHGGGPQPKIQVAVIDSPYGDLPEAAAGLSSASTATCRAGSIPGFSRRPAGSTACGPTTWCRSAPQGHGGTALLLIHGESDTIVPVSQAYELARAAGSIVPDDDPARASSTSGAIRAIPRVTSRTIEAFFDDHLSP